MAKIKHVIFDHDGTLVDTTSFKRELFPGIVELLKYLSSQGIKSYIWTARNRDSTVEILQSLAIIDHFSGFACGGEMKPKPSVQGLESLLIEDRSESIALVGDSLGDMIGGRSFGALCIGALWGHGNLDGEKVMLESGADICFGNVLEFKKFLEDKI